MVEIIKGEDKVITVRLKNENGDPIDLSTASSVAVSFKKADQSDLDLTLSSGIALISGGSLGKFTITLTDAQTALLKAVSNATMEIAWTIGTSTTKKQVLKAYSVIASLF